ASRAERREAEGTAAAERQRRHKTRARRTRMSTTCSNQDQSESSRSIGTLSTTWRRHPFITSESCVHSRTRLRGPLFSRNWAMGGSAYNRRTVTLRDRYSSGLRSTRLYLSSTDSRPAPG